MPSRAAKSSIILLTAVAVAACLSFAWDSMNVFLMGFFRDVGRIKAHRRRMGGNDKALVVNMLLHLDDPLDGIDLDAENDESQNDVTTYTETELLEFGKGKNADEDENGGGGPLLLSLFGRVYDVSAGHKYYGEGGRYHAFAGRDVTRALCTGCTLGDCILRRDLDGLTDKQLDEGKRWLSFFHFHDKYAYVGKMEGGEGWESLIDGLVDESLRLEDNKNLEKESNLEEHGDASECKREN